MSASHFSAFQKVFSNGAVDVLALRLSQLSLSSQGPLVLVLVRWHAKCGM